MPTFADPRAATWRTLLSLPGRVGIVEPIEDGEVVDHQAILRRVQAEVRFESLRRDGARA